MKVTLTPQEVSYVCTTNDRTMAAAQVSGHNYIQVFTHLHFQWRLRYWA